MALMQKPFTDEETAISKVIEHTRRAAESLETRVDATDDEVFYARSLVALLAMVDGGRWEYVSLMGSSHRRWVGPKLPV